MRAARTETTAFRFQSRATCGETGVEAATADGAIKLWPTSLGKERAILRGHLNAVQAVAVAADGNVLATGGHDKVIRLWDAATGKERGVLRGHTGLALSLAFAPDGRTIASAGADRTVRVWQLPGNEQIRRFTGHMGWISSVAFSADGRRAVSAKDFFVGYLTTLLEPDEILVEAWFPSSNPAHGALHAVRGANERDRRVRRDPRPARRELAGDAVPTESRLARER